MLPLTVEDAPPRGSGSARGTYGDVVEERNRRQNVIRLGALLCLVLTLYDGGRSGQAQVVKQQQAAAAASKARSSAGAGAGAGLEDSSYVRSAMVSGVEWRGVSSATASAAQGQGQGQGRCVPRCPAPALAPAPAHLLPGLRSHCVH